MSSSNLVGAYTFLDQSQESKESVRRFLEKYPLDPKTEDRGGILTIDLLFNSTTEEDGKSIVEFLRQILRELDPKRGRIIRPPVLGRIEIECRADKVHGLWERVRENYLSFEIAIIRNLSDHEFESKDYGFDPHTLFHFQSLRRNLQSVRLVSNVRALRNSFGATDVGKLASSFEALLTGESKGDHKDNLELALIRSWAILSDDIVRIASDPAHRAKLQFCECLPQLVVERIIERFANAPDYEEVETPTENSPAIKHRRPDMPIRFVENMKANEEMCRSVADPTAVELARRLLDKTVADLGASGYALFVKDLYLDGVFRLELMSGIEYPEMLSGFCGYNDTGWVFENNDEPEVYCANQKEAAEKLPKARWHNENETRKFRKLMATKNAFAYYFTRENLSSLAVLHGTFENKPCMAAYINFKDEDATYYPFGNRARGYLRALNIKLSEIYPHFVRESFRCGDLDLLARLGKHVQYLANVRFDQGMKPRLECINRFLGEIVKILRIEDDGLVTIHEKSAGSDLLSLIDSVGRTPNPGLRFQKIFDGRGLLSWVALHRRPIRIDNLERKQIKQLVGDFHGKSESFLVIPMCAGENGKELVGILSIECNRQNAFNQDQLIILSLVANHFARVWRQYGKLLLEFDVAMMRAHLSRMDIIPNKLSSLIDVDQLWKSTVDKNKSEFERVLQKQLERYKYTNPKHVEEWLNQTVRLFKADAGSVWMQREDTIPNEDVIHFELLATTPNFSPNPPRGSGWTQYVAKTRQIICITGVKSEQNFRTLYFVGTKGNSCWSDELPNSTPLPPDVNISDNFGSELGFPLLDNDVCFGVVWLKYQIPYPISQDGKIEHEKDLRPYEFAPSNEICYVPKEDRIQSVGPIVTELSLHHRIFGI